MADRFRNWLRTLGAPEDPVATDTTSPWSAMSLLKAIFEQLQAGIIPAGVLIFQGAWDASAGTFPGAGVAGKGWLYKVTVAGTVNGVAFSVGDDIYAVADNASTTTYANNWLKVEGSMTLAEIETAVGFTLRPVLETKVGTYTVVAADHGKTIVLDGFFTLSLTAAATLGNTFWVDIIIAGTRRPTIDPAGAELIDGAATIHGYPGQGFRICCSGTQFYTKGRSPNYRLNAAATFFISMAGSATNDGLAIGSPMTMAAMQEFIRSTLDQGGNTAQVQMADGTYPAFAQMAGHWHHNHNLEFIGNAGNQNAVIIAAPNAGDFAAYVSDYARVVFRYMRFAGHASANSIVVEQHGVVGVDTVTFAGCNTAIRASIGGNFKTNGVITLEGVHGITMQATDGGMIEIGASAHVVSAGYSNTFGATAQGAGATVIADVGATFSGAGFPGAGQKYLAQLNGVIRSNGAGESFFPGTAAGDQTAGGRYL